MGAYFELELPAPDLCDRVEARTAGAIAERVLPLPHGEQTRALRDLLRPAVAAAVEACRMADRLSRRSAAAAVELLHARAAGGYWTAGLEGRADAWMMEAAEMLIVAHRRCQEAHGVNRAVEMAARRDCGGAGLGRPASG